MRITFPDRTTLIRFAALASGALAAWPAAAHHAMDNQTPQTLVQGLLSGFAHPLIGPDHLAFLVAAALLTATLVGAARYFVPLFFVAATLAGTALHLRSADVPMVETLVSLSVLAAAILLLLRRQPGALALAALFVVSGVLHGYAYGESIVGAERTPLLAYLVGFTAIQYAVIVGGGVLLDALARRAPAARALAARIATGGAMLTGGVFLALSFA